MGDRQSLSTPDVSVGYILAYRLFDVAYAIDLGKAEETWARMVRTGSSRGRLTSTPPKALAFGVPPVSLGLGAVTLPLSDGPVQATATARLYDFGVISIGLRLPVVDVSWAVFSQRLNAVDRAVGLASGAALWSDLLDRIRLGVGEGLVRPMPSSLQEDYLVGVANAFSEKITAEALAGRLDLVPLLSGEQRPLSEGARRDLLRHQYLSLHG